MGTSQVASLARSAEWRAPPADRRAAYRFFGALTPQSNEPNQQINKFDIFPPGRHLPEGFVHCPFQEKERRSVARDGSVNRAGVSSSAFRALHQGDNRKQRWIIFPRGGSEAIPHVYGKPDQPPHSCLRWLPVVPPFVAHLDAHRLGQLITADSDGFCKLWDLRTFSCLETFTSSVSEESRVKSARKSRNSSSCAPPTRVSNDQQEESDEGPAPHGSRATVRKEAILTGSVPSDRTHATMVETSRYVDPSFAEGVSSEAARFFFARQFCAGFTWKAPKCFARVSRVGREVHS